MKISWCGETCFQITTLSNDNEGVSISIDEKEEKNLSRYCFENS